MEVTCLPETELVETAGAESPKRWPPPEGDDQQAQADDEVGQTVVPVVSVHGEPLRLSKNNYQSLL